MLPLRPNSSLERYRIARRRNRLSIDYQDLTHTWLYAHTSKPGSLTRAAFQLFARVRRQFLPHYFVSPPAWRVRMRQLLKDRALPDFCVIGPAKSGTSDLAITIMSHPNVMCPLVKELAFIDPMDWRPYYPTLSAVQRHAQRHGVALCPFVGPLLHFLDVSSRLADIRPGAKIVINLRNPVDLVFSEWKWSVLHRSKPLVDRVSFLVDFHAFVDKAIDVFPEAPSPFGNTLHYGIYASSVSHWLRHFGAQNVRVFDIAEYFRDRSVYFQRLEQFVGLPHILLPPRLPVANRNPLDGLTPDADACEKLRAFFAPYNRDLWNVIGAVLSW